MRWWLNTDHGRFSVDNAVVNGMDMSSLDPTIWMVQWQDGRGEIERQNVADDTNDNGLRENFIDVIPYAPLFQQFLSLCPLLTLTQAKKVDIDLIRQIFESKRQAPFHYPIAAGDYYWDATDDSLFSSTIPAIQNATAALNTVITRLNALVASINAIDANIVNGVNADVATINSGITAIGNVLVGQVNTLAGEANGAFAAETDFVNNTMLGVFIGTGDPTQTINNKLKSGAFTGLAAVEGFSVDIAHFGGVTINYIAPGTFSNVAPISSGGPISWPTIPPVTTANAQWIPIGATAPVTVTPAEQAGIMNGIAARTNDLNAKKNIKIAEVNAMTAIAEVIAYDVTTGW